MNDPDQAPKIDTVRPDPARRYNYWLGGKDNFAADRDSGDRIAAAYPQVLVDVRDNRDWVLRAVRFLAAEAGIRQFLDIGAGLPTADNVHEVARKAQPDARVVYVDNNPLVMAHARALLTSVPPAVTEYALQDMRDPEALLTDPHVKDVLDLTQPVAVILAAVLHFIESDGEAYYIVKRLVEAMPSGSFLVLSHFTDDLIEPGLKQTIATMAGKGKKDGVFQPRTLGQIAGFFDGLTVVEPGLVTVSDWGRDTSDPLGHPPANIYGGIGRKD